jgi:hypothetical protein
MELDRNNLSPALVRQYWNSRRQNQTESQTKDPNANGATQGTTQGAKPQGLEAFPKSMQDMIEKTLGQLKSQVQKDFPEQGGNAAYRVGRLKAQKELNLVDKDVFATQVMAQIRKNRQAQGRGLDQPANDAEVRAATLSAAKGLRTEFENNLKSTMRSTMGFSSGGRGSLANYLA